MRESGMAGIDEALERGGWDLSDLRDRPSAIGDRDCFASGGTRDDR